MGSGKEIVYSELQKSEDSKEEDSPHPLTPTPPHTLVSSSVPIQSGKIQGQLSLIQGSFPPKFLNPVPSGLIQHFED